MAGVRRGAFTCVGCQVTLCDPTWQVMSRSSEVGLGIPQEELATFERILAQVTASRQLGKQNAQQLQMVAKQTQTR